MKLRPKYNIVLSTARTLNSGISACDMMEAEMLIITPTIGGAGGVYTITQVTITLNAKYGTIGIYAPVITLTDSEGNISIFNRNNTSNIYLPSSPVPISAGVYYFDIDDFTYTLTNNELCSKDLRYEIEFNTFEHDLPAPIAAASYLLDGATLSSITGALSLSSNGSLTFSWDWGDGTTFGTGVTPGNHTYSYNGTYNLTLTVTDAAGKQGVVTFIIRVALAPVAVQKVPVAVQKVPVYGAYVHSHFYTLDASSSTSSDLSGDATYVKWSFYDYLTGAFIAATGFGDYLRIFQQGTWLSGSYKRASFWPNALVIAYNSSASRILARLQVQDANFNTSNNLEEVLVYTKPVVRWKGDTALQGVDGVVSIDPVTYNFADQHYKITGYVTNGTAHPFIPLTDRTIVLGITQVGVGQLAQLEFDYSTFINSATQTPITEVYPVAGGIADWNDLKIYMIFTVNNQGKIEFTFDKYQYSVDHGFIDSADDTADGAGSLEVAVLCIENNDLLLSSATSTAVLPPVTSAFEEVGGSYITFSGLKNRIIASVPDALIEFYEDGERAFYLPLGVGDFSQSTSVVGAPVGGIAVGLTDTSLDARLDPDVFINVTSASPDDSANRYRYDHVSDSTWEFVESLNNGFINGQALHAYERLIFESYPIYFIAGVVGEVARLAVAYLDTAVWQIMPIINTDISVKEILGITVDQYNNIYFAGNHCVRRLKWTPTVEDADDPSTWLPASFTLETVAGMPNIAGNTLNVTGLLSRFSAVKDIVIVEENYGNLGYPRLMITTGSNQLVLLTPTENTGNPSLDFTTSLLSGSITGASGNENGVNTIARFNNPVGIAKKSNTEFFVSDNNGLRKVTFIGNTTINVITIVAYDDNKAITTGEKIIF